MNNLELYGGGNVLRQTNRAVSRLQSRSALSLAHVDAMADLQAAKVDAMSAVAQRGLQGAAFISQVEQQLAQAVPLAATRLQAIGDIGALGLSQIVMDTANKLRRI